MKLQGKYDLTLSAGGQLQFRQATTITDVADLTLGGTINAKTAANANVALVVGADTIRFNGATTFVASNLTLTSTNAQTPADADATPDDLTINISGDLTLRGEFNIGTGDLDVDGTALIISGTTSFTAATMDLTLTDTGDSATTSAVRKAATNGNYGLTLTAPTIDITASVIAFGRQENAGLTLAATTVNLRTNTEINVSTLELGGIVTSTGNLKIFLGEAPTFSGNTTITASAITLSATAAGTKSTVTSVILRATGDITLTGSVINISGTVDFHAGASTSDTLGDVKFEGDADVSIVAGAIILRQDETAFGAAAPSGVAFNSVTPTIYYRNTANDPAVTAWATDGNNLLFDVNITGNSATTEIEDAQGNTITIDLSDGLSAAELGEIFEALLGVGNTNPTNVDIAGYDIVINITGAIELPSNLTAITADNITIIAASLSGGNAADLTLTAGADTLRLGIGGGISRTGSLNLDVAGGNLNLDQHRRFSWHNRNDIKLYQLNRHA